MAGPGPEVGTAGTGEEPRRTATVLLQQAGQRHRPEAQGRLLQELATADGREADCTMETSCGGIQSG